jgi:ABC-type uncharacterized transport system involved in gliding motility auxiliary subunit
MRRTAALYGIIGLVLLCFGLIDFFLASGFRLFVAVNIIGGLFAIVLWLTSSRSALASIAGRRATRYGLNAAVYTVAFVGILVAINYLGTLHRARLDLTAERIYSLSPQSVKVVQSLNKPIRLIGFFPGGESPQARELYEMYAYASPNVKFQLVDPDKSPELAERYKVSVMNTTHIQYGDAEKGEGTNVTDLNEQALTNAIIRVTRQGKKVIDFLDGHGESDPDETQDAGGFGALRKDLEGEGYEVRKMVLASLPKVPDDVSIVVVAGPQKPLLPHEIDALNDYLKRGGRMILMFRPQPPDQPIDESAMIKLAGEWGVQVGNDVVVDQVLRLFAGPALGLNPIVQSYGTHPITTGFTQRTVFPMTRSLDAEANLKPGLTVTALGKTSDTSWAEIDLEGIFRRQEAKLTSKDIRGPITVAEAVTGDLAKLFSGKGEARLLMYGSSEFVDNQYINTFYNRDFFMNGAEWLVGEESQIAIRPRSLRASRFRLTVDQFSVVFALSVLLLPELLLIAGIWVWWERRN